MAYTKSPAPIAVTPRLTGCLDFKAYRESLGQTQWWLLDVTYVRDWDWVLKVATVCLWPINWGLLINLSGRFLLGGAGLAGVSALALANLAPLLKARSSLSKSSALARLEDP